ncbi:hypothetical protein MIR68_000422 [Amoeboaphelidium protococcarum]|nr:hypothetical protein MIR68_000422 [Amoeboaphelidium protococcarum]
MLQLNDRIKWRQYSSSRNKKENFISPLEVMKMWQEGWKRATPHMSKVYGALALFALAGYILRTNKSKDSQQINR